MEVGYYHSSLDKAVLDYLLPGMGQVWLRYEPQIESDVADYDNAAIQSTEKTASDVQEDGDGEPYETLAYEKCCVDYVYYLDFLWSPARCWEENRWVRKRSYLSRSQLNERFGEEKGKRVTLDCEPDRTDGETYTDKTLSYFKKAEVWEIWNKPDRKVYFIAPGTPGLVLDVRDDPLKLEGFWPCPQPLFTTQTNDTLVPVPDYIEYQDQARELDDLTDRISRLTSAVKAVGVYNAEYKELARLLQEGVDNKLLPVDQWAAFAEKGGMPGAVSLLPLKEIIETLIRLYEARDRVKADLYEITGISDIVRGYSGGAAKTATEQRIKGQFASLRLEDRRAAVARFCRDTLAIEAEIVCEQFSDESLMLMSGYEQVIQDKVRKAVEAVQQPPAPSAQPGQPPEMAQQQQMLAQQQFQQAQEQASQQAQAAAMQEFQQALQILRSDKLRGFRIDIETDSTIQVDAQADKEAATELLSGTVAALGQMGEVLQAAPELAKPVLNLFLFVYRRFRVGRTLESEFNEAIDQITERMENPQPQPPSPEQIKAQGEMQRQQMEGQRAQQEFGFEQQSKQMDMQFKEREHALKMQELETEFAFKQREFQLKEQEIVLKEREFAMRAAQPLGAPNAA
jgi:hypothetical protein